MDWRSAVTGLLVAGLASVAMAHGYKVRTLEIEHPWTRVTAAAERTVSVGMRIVNKGKEADRLLRATSGLATTAVIVAVGPDVERAREAGTASLSVPAGKTVELTPSGHRIVLGGLSRSLGTYEMIPLTLIFERAGRIEVEVMVEEVEAPTRPAS